MYVDVVIYFGILSVSNCVSNSKDPSPSRSPKIEEEACDVKPTQLSVQTDPISRALVKPNVYNILINSHSGFTQLV